MKLTLIVPDIHLRVEQAEKIVKSAGADEVIFLGDYFDDFGDNIDMIQAACDWLEYSVKQPNRIHLFGNHDVHYAHSYRWFQCSGYEQWKYFAIHDRIDNKTWDKLKYYHILDGQWLLTHAGLHKQHLPKNIQALHTNRPKFYETIDQFLNEAIREAFRCSGKWAFAAGAARWGNQAVGGITWCDFTHEFYPINGLNQIFGHTPLSQGAQWCYTDPKGLPHRSPSSLWTPTAERIDDSSASTNLCLDVHGNTHWAIWDGKTMKIFNYREDL